MPTFSDREEGVENCRQCRGCLTWTRCKFGWCYGCYGDMRRIDGILYDLCTAANALADTALLATVESMGLVPDDAWPNVKCSRNESPWEVWSARIEMQVRELKQKIEWHGGLWK